MRVEARIPEFGDLLRKEFHPVGRVAEDDRLVDLELGEECVKAMNFLLFFDECVILGYSTESEFIHQVDLIWRFHVLVLKTMVSRGCNSQKPLIP